MLSYLLIAYILADIGAPAWMFLLAIFCAAVKFLTAGGDHS